MRFDNLRDLLALNLAVMLFGMSGVVSWWLDLPPWLVASARCLVSSLCLFLVLRTFKVPPIRGRHLATCVVAGGLLGAHWWSFFQSIRVSSVAVGTFAFASFPLFTMGMEALTGRRAPSGRDLLLGVGMLAGIGIMASQGGLKSANLPGIAFGLLSSLTFATLALMNSSLVLSHNPFSVAMAQQWWAFVFLSPWALHWGIPPLGLAKLLGLISMGAIFTALAHGLFISSMRTISPSRAALVSGLEPVYATLVAALLGQRPSLRELLGGSLVLIFAVLANLPGPASRGGEGKN